MFEKSVRKLPNKGRAIDSIRQLFFNLFNLCFVLGKMIDDYISIFF